MPRLHTIGLPRMTTGLLRRLLRRPRDLQWQQITLPLQLDNGAAALLSQMPTLTKLDANSMVCTQFDWLHVLTDLTHVELRLQKPAVAGRAESLVAALQHCTKIRTLLLEGAEITHAHLTELMPLLPQLRQLELRKSGVSSLSFLAQQPMTQQLSTLHLDGCRQLPLTELRHVHSLRRLKVLGVVKSFNERMDSYSQSLYTPPSVHMPQLDKFDYTEP